MDKQLNYWRVRLANLPILELPIDKTRPLTLPFHEQCQAFTLPQNLCAKLTLLSQRENLDASMLLLAVFQVLLNRYSGSEDIVLGVLINNRNQRIAANNTVILRIDFAENPSFLALLLQLKAVLAEAYEHQDISLAKLVEVITSEQDSRRNPLFQFRFVLNQVTHIPQQLNTLDVEKATTPYDLTLELHETAQGLHPKIEVKYSADLFTSETIERFIAHYLTLLEAIITQPEVPLSEFSMLTASERQQLLLDWNDTTVPFRADQGIHEFFVAHAAQTPHAIALVYEESQLTYAELNSQANQLAFHLLSIGVKPDLLVAICVERSFAMMIAILAILKAGGAYLPLNPNYPVDMLHAILEDSAPVALLTQTKLANLFEKMTLALPVINLETDASSWTNNPSHNPEPQVIGLSAKHLAYVIYTSGSTGKPKGVMVEHQGLCSMITDLSQRYKIVASDRVLQFAPIAFDMSVEEIFVALSSGATLVLRNDDLITDADNFWQRCAVFGVTVINLPTLFWQQLVQDEQVEIPRCVRQVMIGGDAVSSTVLAAWLKSVKYRPKLFNAYGPTEATVNATIHEPTLNSLSWQCIGRPISNTQIYILDAHYHPMAIGHAGELYIGGVGVARGYLKQPELTAERFVNNPFSALPNARLYKTGDRARWLTDGTIEFLGRNDFQVKIRDFRIELGAIESRLAEHSALREVAVIARNEGDSGKRLVAYLVVKASYRPPVAELRDFLTEKLPLYMVPAAFVFLDVLPVTPNGKLDRKKLPEPDHNRQILDTDFIAPRNLMEQQLAEIWTTLLQIDTIGVYDNFFDLGGHSILAIKLIVAIGKLFKVNLSLGTIYEAPTIEQLARIITTGEQQAKFFSLVPIQAQGTRPPLFVIHTALEDLPRFLDSEQPIYFLRYGLAAEYSHQPMQLPKLKELASHYIEELQTFQPQGPYQLIGFSFGGLIAYEMACQLNASGFDVGFLGLIDTSLTWEKNLLPYRRIVHKLLSLNVSQLWEMLKDKIDYYLNPEDQDTNFWPHLYTFGSEWDCRQGFQPEVYREPIFLFKATERETMFYVYESPEVSWQKILRGNIQVELVPGNHLQICKAPNAKILAEKISVCLLASGSHFE